MTWFIQHTLLKNLWKNEQFHRLSKGEQNGITSTESNTYQTTDTFIIYPLRNNKYSGLFITALFCPAKDWK